MAKRSIKRTTLQQVADRAGVHQSTASRALDPRTRHLITDDVVAKVERAVAQLHYRHNRVAAGLRTNRTRAIGIIVPDITNMLFPPIIRGVENRIAEDGFVAMIAHTDGDRSCRTAAMVWWSPASVWKTKPSPLPHARARRLLP
jgi:LacI family transcriptional regulator